MKSYESTSTESRLSVAEALRIIGDVGWISRRSKEVRAQLQSIAQLRQFEAGQFVYHAGDPSNGIYGLVSGALDVSIPRVDGQELVVHRADPGFWIGDLAIFSSSQRLVSVRAVSSAKVLFLAENGLRRLVSKSPALIADFYQLSHENMKTTLALLGNLSIPGAQNRIALRLLVQDQSTGNVSSWINLSHSELATLVAMSPLTVRRTLKQLEEAGLVETGYRRMRIVDRQSLAQMCGYSAAGEVPR